MTDTQPQSRLDALVGKYGYEPKAVNAPQATYRAFDSTYNSDISTLKRVSKSPSGNVSGTDTGSIHAEMAGINLDLAGLAEEYGKLNVDLKSLVGKDKIYGVSDVAAIGWYNLTRQKSKVRQVKLDAAQRRGDAIEILVNRMGEVLSDQYQKSVTGKTRAKQLQVENISHMKLLDRKLIDSLKSGYGKGVDYALGEAEVSKLEKELSDIDQVLTQYEGDVQTARSKGDLEAVSKYTTEMSQVLDIKHGVLDGRLAAEGVVSEIRRQILDSSEGVQSAKGAIAASKVNYQAISTLTDAMNELEIKYRHAMSDMIPVFKIQGKVAGIGMSALDMKDTLLKVADASQRLMDANSRLVTHLAAQTFDLLKTPIYDPERARQVEEQIRGFMSDLNKAKMDWAQQVQSVNSQTPHYTKPQ